MLAKRTLVVVVLLPVGLSAIYLGGWFFTGLVLLISGLAVWEYINLFQSGGLQPARVLALGGTLLVVLGRATDGFESAPWIASLIILSCSTYHLVAYERGRDLAASDFASTLSAILYIGWLGAYFVSLRNLPQGMWWFLVVLPSVWIADSGAYLVGSRYGRWRMTPRLSPHKTWEGFLGGVVSGSLSGLLLGFIGQTAIGPAAMVTPLRGAILGFILSVLTPLGDLAESMIKRQVGAKDSGNLLPGHGGALDRIDSWLWAGVIGYYVITWFYFS